MTVDIEKLEALAKAAIEQAKRWKGAGEPWPIWNKCVLEMQAAANPTAVLELTQTIRDLQSSVQGLKTGYEAYERVNAELRAECEALRKDAERAAYWKQRAKSAEGHLFSSDVEAGAKAMHKCSLMSNTTWDQLAQEDQWRCFHAAFRVIAAVNGERDRRQPGNECGITYAKDSA
uniref:Initiation-control protein YabA n=3 Tax=unclassified bacterial viruses TaxID=12333 RepID=A0AAU6W2S4_9VIRU